MKYTVYHEQTGQVIRWGEVPQEDFAAQAIFDDEAVIEGEYPGDKFYWNGQAMQDIPPQPFGCVWDWDTKAWVADLAGARAAKWQEMKDARTAALTAPLATPYGAFDTDPASRANIVQTAQLMQTQAQSFAPSAAPTVAFTLADNTVATLTAGQMVSVALLLAQQIQIAYDRGRQVRAAIEAATTAQEVQAVSWAQ